jgi:NADP-dependent 3-hydroxy acid dehydrogenase YdfG
MYAASKHAAGALTESIRVALLGEPIRITAIMPGPVATNMVRTMPQEQLFTIARTLGQNPDEMEFTPGEHVPQELLDGVATMAKNFVMRPEDVASAVMYALSVPENVQISEIMLRPLQPLQMPGLRLPA